MLKKIVMLLALVLISLLSSVSLAQDSVTAETLVTLNMRGAPVSGAVIAKLPVGTTVIVEGRNDAVTWLLVHTPDGSEARLDGDAVPAPR